MTKLRGYLKGVEERIKQKKLFLSQGLKAEALTASSEGEVAREVEQLSAYFFYKRLSQIDRRDETVQTEAAHETRARPSANPPTERGPRESCLTRLAGSVRRHFEANSVRAEATAALERMRSELEALRAARAEGEAAEDDRLALHNEVFVDFFYQASKFVEKVLPAAGGANPAAAAQAVLGPVLPADVREQLVRDICWSSIIPEMCLSVHEAGETDAGSAAGDRIYLWNAEFPARPEFELLATASVARALFSPFNSEQVLAGMDSGQLCLYDLRAHKRPVMRSLPGAEGHKSPVLAMEFIGGKQSNTVLCASEDGRLCLWSLNKLDFPLRSVEVLPAERRREDDLATPLEPFCLATIPNDTSSLFVGASDAVVHRFHIASAQIEEVPAAALRSHGAAVTCLAHNKSTNFASQLSESMLSGSLDWCVKLWSVKRAQPLFTFELGGDAVTDLQWNPAHPAMFLAADAAGGLAVMDLFKSFERPVWSRTKGQSVLSAKWDSSGRLLAVSTCAGGFQIERFDTALLEYGESGYEYYEQRVGTPH